MKVVGLTGGIGSGKSTVANLFANLKVPLIDADVIARDLVGPGMPALLKIQDHFGDNYIDAKGQLNRPLLKQKIFEDHTAKTTLEKILHPMIRHEIQSQIKRLNGLFCIVVIPLLVESIDDYGWLDAIIVVDVPEAIQIERAMLRDSLDENFIKSILAKQATRQQRLAIADYVIDNTQDINTLEGQVFDLFQTLKTEWSPPSS